MKILAVFFLLLMSCTIDVQAQQAEERFRIFDGRGNPVNLGAIIGAIENADVVFLGELHDDATAHRLQLEIFSRVIENYGRQRKVALSLEMFERDVQVVLDEYLQGLISETHFLASSRPWNNYKTDYRPLVELAREKNLSVIAANAPRRYVNMVSRLGRESLNRLSPEAKNWLAPLPYADASEAYAKRFNALMGQMSATGQHSGMLNAQALWDATMAHSIFEFRRVHKDSLVVNLNGSFHTENRLGTVEHLLRFDPKVRIVVVTMRYEDDFTLFDRSKHENIGDFVVLTDAKAPRSSR